MPEEPAIKPFPLTPDPSPERTSGRLYVAMCLQHDGLNMMRQTMKRRFPDETPAQRQARISDWMAYTPEIDDARFEVRPCKVPSNTTSGK